MEIEGLQLSRKVKAPTRASGHSLFLPNPTVGLYAPSSAENFHITKISLHEN